MKNFIIVCIILFSNIVIGRDFNMEKESNQIIFVAQPIPSSIYENMLGK